MNHSKPDVQHPLDSHHWLNDQEIDQQLKKGLTAFLPLDDAFLSIASRLHLIRSAKYRLDLQYYIWNNDVIGRMMLFELLKAADRGVKIRLMIDDQNGTQLDPQLQALGQHPNFSIKLFNPYKFRHLRALDYIFRPQKINHRMHNKLIVADDAIAVTGGRNISREYFEASDEFQFTDLDILFYGTAVQNAAHVFLSFWNDNLSYSTQQILPNHSRQELENLRAEYAYILQNNHTTAEQLTEAEQQIQHELKNRPIQWAKAHFVADHPNKIRGNATSDQLIYNQMLNLMGQPKNHIELVSAYFVPTTFGTKYLTALREKNIKVRILTNSLVANDVALVHAFYQKYRYDLLKNGVQLYEFKPYIERPNRTWYERITGNIIPAKGKNTSSLHAKFFDIDGMVFIGSFNFDPRSAHLNSEVGLVIESNELQNRISTELDRFLPYAAYELKLNQNQQMVWLEQKSNGEIIEHSHDPETTRFQRLSMIAVSYFPIEWMM